MTVIGQYAAENMGSAMLVSWQYCEWSSVHVLKSLTFRFSLF